MASSSTQNASDVHANRRSTPRTSAPSIKVRCDGGLYVPDNWGLGGCLISNYKGQLRPGTSVLIELFLNVVHEHDGLPVRAEIVRYEPDNNNALAFRFESLSAGELIDFCDIIDESLSAEVLKAIS